MSQHIGFRCPDDLIDAIQKEMEATGKDRTTVITEAMRRGFSLPINDVDERLSRLEALVNERLGKQSA